MIQLLEFLFLVYFVIGLLVYIYHCIFWPKIQIFGPLADMVLMITTWPFGLYIEIHNLVRKIPKVKIEKTPYCINWTYWTSGGSENVRHLGDFCFWVFNHQITIYYHDNPHNGAR